MGKRKLEAIRAKYGENSGNLNPHDDIEDTTKVCVIFRGQEKILSVKDFNEFIQLNRLRTKALSGYKRQLRLYRKKHPNISKYKYTDCYAFGYWNKWALEGKVIAANTGRSC